MMGRDQVVDAVVDSGRVPDVVLEAAIRALLRRRRAREGAGGPLARRRRLAQRLDAWSTGPVALATEQANTQHYHVPVAFYCQMLGPHLKYSAGLWRAEAWTGRACGTPGALAAAEEAMLELVMRRADLCDGQRILELGCGWGSVTLWMARRMPHSEIVAVSNSTSQAAEITARAAGADLDNVTVVTADVNDFGVDAATHHHVADGFDRVVSVEMFEHVRNHARLLDRIAAWLRPHGHLFLHVFCNRAMSYPFDSATPARSGSLSGATVSGAPVGAGDGHDVARGTDWMARHFFTGGVMPSLHHFRHLDTAMQVRHTWAVDGRHYAATCRAWRARLDADPQRAAAALGGGDLGARRLARWRVFTMACEQLFALDDGGEWFVAHHLMVPAPAG